MWSCTIKVRARTTGSSHSFCPSTQPLSEEAVTSRWLGLTLCSLFSHEMSALLPFHSQFLQSPGLDTAGPQFWERMHSSPLPALPHPHSLPPLLLSHPVQRPVLWGRGREERESCGWMKVWWWVFCIVGKKGPLWKGIRMDNLLGHLLTPPEHLKFFFKYPVGMHQVVYRGVSLEFYLTCINLVEEGKVKQLWGW